ncbi:hypothetical protein BGZ59_007009 [Podila verticillata]|nr:hypothetical protein BGZ59_007009 [Podila verticillata]
MSNPSAPKVLTGSRPKNAFASNSRIPLDYCDGPTQRMYAASSFALLQAFKIYYFMQMTQSDYAAGFFGFILWVLLDAIFISTIHYLRIPWLELPALRLIIALVFLTICNFILFTVREVTYATLAQSSVSLLWRIVPSFSRREASYHADQDAHLLGRHTVFITPYSSAVMNPEDQCFCIPMANLPVIEQPEIPIIFNGSHPHAIEYTITSFETGTTSTHKVAGPFRESSSVLKKVRSGQDGVSVYTLQATLPGAYKLQRLLDKEGVDIRFFKGKEVFVVGCPEARIDHHKVDLDRCAGKGDVDVPIVVQGLPPWRVTYKRQSKLGTQDLLIEEEPAGYSSPFLKGWSPPSKQDYSWAKQHEMNLSAHLGLGTPGDYSFQVTKVKDGCGNVIDLQGLVSRGLREPEIRHVKVRSRPSVTMKCDPRKPIKIVTLGDSPKAKIDLDIKNGDGPFHIGYVYQKSDIEQPEPMKDVIIPKGQESASITANRPGLYTLAHIKDNFCEGEVQLPRDCTVAVATLPTVEISTTTIEDQCVGAIGVSIAATFTGEGPWKVCYDVYRNDRLDRADVCQGSDKPRLTLKMTPELSGAFKYKFKSVSDKNYKAIKVNLPPVFQNIHPQPSASFTDKQSGIRACKGSTKRLGVQLVGNGPWDIRYQVIHKGQSRVFTENNIISKTTNITLPAFDNEGTYSVDLESVTDRSNGCTKALSVSDVVIDVSNGPPTVSFQCDSPREFPEGGSVDLPILLTGGAPWYLTYGMEGQDSYSTVKSDARNALVSVSKAGTYELRSVKDSYCEGNVVEQAQKCVVVQSERPTMNLKIDSIRFRGGPRGDFPEDEISPSEKISREGDHFVLPPVCQDADRSLEFRLTGKEPFELRYKTVFKPAKGGRDIVTERKEVAYHSTMRLPVITDQPGTVFYHLETLSDSTYKDVKVLHEKHVVVFRHVIRTPPKALIHESTKKQQFCKNEAAGVTDKIAIKIEDGAGPYTLAIEVRILDVPEKVYVHDVVPNKHGIYEWTLPAKFTDVGVYGVSVLRVSDSNGCSSSNDDKHSSVEFEILDTPTITPLRSIRDACVGERIDFSLQGESPPFKVYYKLDKSNHESTLDSHSNKFSYLATKSGNLTISKVCQTIGRKQCCTQPPEDLSAKIWDLPTAKIAGGSNIITNLRDGDRAEIEVTFQGEAPFSFGYVRREAHFDPKRPDHVGHENKILEKKKLSGIHDKKYSFFAAAEGTFELTFIRDKHCQVGREQ